MLWQSFKKKQGTVLAAATPAALQGMLGPASLLASLCEAPLRVMCETISPNLGKSILPTYGEHEFEFIMCGRGPTGTYFVTSSMF